MNDKEHIAFLERYIETLEREKTAALEALDLAGSMGSFELEYSQTLDSELILRELCRRVGIMVELQNAAVYLIDGDTHDIAQAYYDFPDLSTELNREVDGLIQDSSFAYAMQSERPCFFLASDKQKTLFLHVLTTPKRVRGMFVGLLAQDKGAILDTTLSLLTVVILAGAHALESHEINRLFQNHRRKLEHEVQIRTIKISEANAHLSAILDNIHAGVLLVDAQTHVIVDMNPAGLRMVRANREDVVGRRCFRFLCPSQAGDCPITDRGLDVDNAERLLLTTNGETIPIIKTVSRTVIDGRPHLIETFIDISEQKKLERLKEDIEKITRHDLKSPLNGIIGVPDLLLETATLNDDERVLVQAIKDSGLKMLRMINMSLDLYKMEIGAYDYIPRQVDLSPLLRSLLRDLHDQARCKSLQIVVLLDDAHADLSHPVLITGEELLLYSMLANLLKNAVEASPKGEEVRVSVVTSPQKTIAIRNVGEIHASVRDRFFEKYWTYGKRGGTGLGTYSALLIAQTMGGDIQLHVDDENKAVLVVITLP